MTVTQVPLTSASQRSCTSGTRSKVSRSGNLQQGFKSRLQDLSAAPLLPSLSAPASGSGSSKAGSSAPPIPRPPALASGSSSLKAGSSASRAPSTSKTSVSSARGDSSRPSASRVHFEAAMTDSDVDMGAEDEHAGISSRYQQPVECDRCRKRFKLDAARSSSGQTCDACRSKPPTKTTSKHPAQPAPSTSAPAPAASAASHKHKPKPRPLYLRGSTHVTHDVLWIDTPFGKQPVEVTSSDGPPPKKAAVPSVEREVPSHRAVVDPPSSDAEPMGLNPEDFTDSDVEYDVPSRATANDKGISKKPRKRRVTKQMRAREFRYWFERVVDEYYVKKAAGDAQSAIAVNDVNYTVVETMHKEGGTAYTTPDEFFDALEERLRAHKEALKEGRKEVLQFRGGYSIVAQPKIGHTARAEKVRAKLREIGLELLDDRVTWDATTDIVAGRVRMVSSWYYPCTCRGTVLPKHRPCTLEKKGEWKGKSCGGQILLRVGGDNSLEAYGIPGQQISVMVVH
ncbi:hypothetical protein OH77DRAFT_96712 [Trametes cingulata]|nr:hypothetical protein OH77DRAFT_96712 [Trametes cingulata]